MEMNGTADVVFARGELVKIAYALDKVYSTEQIDETCLRIYGIISELDDMDDWDKE
jgi:hypothetical protein